MLNNARTDALGKTRQSLSSSPTPLSNYQDYTVQRAEKLRLPNVEVFKKGLHKQYL